MYTNRDFWRNSAIQNPNPSIVKEIYEDYILSYNKERMKSLSINFLDFPSMTSFEKELENLRKRAKQLDIPRLTIVSRDSDTLTLEGSYMQGLGFQKMVELSKCGSQINDVIIRKLTELDLPEEYRLEELSFEDVIHNLSIHTLVNDNFPDGFAESPEDVAAMLKQGHKTAIDNDQIPFYFIILFNGEEVGFSYGYQFTKGPKENMLHLTTAVVHTDHRGKGLYKVLLKARFEASMKHGGRFAYTEADVTTSRPILERLGLEEFERSYIYFQNV